MKHGNEENTTQLRISTPGFIPVSSTHVSSTAILSTAVLSNPVLSTAVSSTHFGVFFSGGGGGGLLLCGISSWYMF